MEIVKKNYIIYCMGETSIPSPVNVHIEAGSQSVNRDLNPNNIQNKTGEASLANSSIGMNTNVQSSVQHNTKTCDGKNFEESHFEIISNNTHFFKSEIMCGR
jgi:hypothetical protein